MPQDTVDNDVNNYQPERKWSLDYWESLEKSMLTTIKKPVLGHSIEEIFMFYLRLPGSSFNNIIEIVNLRPGTQTQRPSLSTLEINSLPKAKDYFNGDVVGVVAPIVA